MTLETGLGFVLGSWFAGRGTPPRQPAQTTESFKVLHANACRTSLSARNCSSCKAIQTTFILPLVIMTPCLIV
jgi:hypothetical protein